MVILLVFQVEQRHPAFAGRAFEREGEDEIEADGFFECDLLFGKDVAVGQVGEAFQQTGAQVWQIGFRDFVVQCVT